MDWYKILAFLGGILVVYILYRGIKGRPNMFTKEALGQSFNTMGILALILIGFIVLCIWLLKQGA